jgi:acyl-CoA synthetase (AMP-forming)/AMP-acid ligase II
MPVEHSAGFGNDQHFITFPDEPKHASCMCQAEFVVAFLGVALARAVAAPLNPAYTEDENKFYMEDAASKLLLVPARGNEHAEAAASSLNIPIATVSLSWAYGTLPSHSLCHL